MFHINKKKSGQTLVEAVVALASIMLTLAAIAIAITTSLSNTNFIQDQSLAAKYSQEGMEYVRYFRNTNPTVFEAREGIYCLNQDNTMAPPCGGAVNIDNRFIREATFTQDSTDCGGGAQVSVSVYWSSGKCPSENRFCHRSELVSCFSSDSGTGNTL